MCRDRDVIVDVNQKWKAKRRSIAPILNPKATLDHAGQHKREVDDARALQYTAIAQSRPQTAAYVGAKSNPPNPSQKRPHPHKRFNMEYRPSSIINGTVSSTADFYRNN